MNAVKCTNCYDCFFGKVYFVNGLVCFQTVNYKEPNLNYFNKKRIENASILLKI